MFRVGVLIPVASFLPTLSYSDSMTSMLDDFSY